MGLSAPAAAALGVANGPNPDSGIAVGPFLVYPTLFLGGDYNDNILGTANNKKAGWGFDVAPGFTAIDDQGLHKTTFNLSADARLYPGIANTGAPSGVTNGNQISLTVSGDHVWNPTPDITVDASAGFQRANSTFGDLSQTAASFASAPLAANVTNYQQYSDLFYASGYVEKRFGNGFFVRTGVGAQDLTYEQAPAGAVTPLGSVSFNGFVRGGYQITPFIAGFTEVGADLMRYPTSLDDSDAYRAIAGLSSDLIGLFRGEVYAGRESAYSPRGVFGSASSPTFGGRVFYYPTRYLTVAASVDDQFGSAASQTGSAPGSTPISRSLLGRLQADYAMAQYWTVTARFGYGRSSYATPSVTEAQLLAGAGATYNFWRNVGLTLNYDFSKTTSASSALPGYVQNIVTAGVTYRY